ncbi:hypothetical protein HK100_002471 [Physocladia obscura]|uniref:Uncharacterized protein n=1 Tax=Physocladia obscura TaxID=109957 RepID=A0AAD5SY08_9FUNG|nr:hypothetical protein HK100_002471 [Physocladia obscura]
MEQSALLELGLFGSIVIAVIALLGLIAWQVWRHRQEQQRHGDLVEVLAHVTHPVFYPATPDFDDDPLPKYVPPSPSRDEVRLSQSPSVSISSASRDELPLFSWLTILNSNRTRTNSIKSNNSTKSVLSFRPPRTDTHTPSIPAPSHRPPLPPSRSSYHDNMSDSVNTNSIIPATPSVSPDLLN